MSSPAVSPSELLTIIGVSRPPACNSHCAPAASADQPIQTSR